MKNYFLSLFTLFILTATQVNALETVVTLHGLPVDPHAVILKEGDVIEVTATAKKKDGKPALLSFDFSAEWSSSPGRYKRAVSKEDAKLGLFEISVATKSGDGAPKVQALGFDDQRDIEFNVQKPPYKGGKNPSHFNKYTFKRRGIEINKETLLKFGDVIEVTATATKKDGKAALISFDAGDWGESPGYYTYTISKENAELGLLQIFIDTKSGDGPPQEQALGYDNELAPIFHVQKPPYTPGKNPSTLSTINVKINPPVANVESQVNNRNNSGKGTNSSAPSSVKTPPNAGNIE